MVKEKVLIVGGGFGGVKTALGLASDERFAVTLLSDQTELRYYPTLYRTATGGAYANSSIPLVKLFENSPITLSQGTASKLDRASKTVTAADGKTYTYDILVLALGVVTNYFGIPGMEEHAYSIKSQAAAQTFKQHIRDQLADTRKPDMNYVIIGGGPTGVELAGALPVYIHKLMKQQGIVDRKVHVDLIEASPRILPRSNKRTSRLVSRRLRRLGVKIYAGSAVQALSDGELTVGGKPIRSHSVVWTAGITNHPFFKENGFVLMGQGKVAVDMFLQAEPNIYVIGDNANTPYSGFAQTALHDGTYLAKQLRRRASGKNPRSYMAKTPVSVIPVGARWAVVTWNGITLRGRLGWLLRQASEVIGFHDLQPWPKAVKQYMTQFETEL